MSIYLLDDLVDARRRRDAIRIIRRLPVGDRDKKQLLGAWFDEHERAVGDKATRRQAYNDLLGRDINAKLGGGK